MLTQDSALRCEQFDVEMSRYLLMDERLAELVNAVDVNISAYLILRPLIRELSAHNRH